MEPDRTGRTLRQQRTERGITLRELSGQTFCDYSQLANIEAGRRWPKDRGWAERVDRALNAGGTLIAAWDADQAERARRDDTLRMLDKRGGSRKHFSPLRTRHRWTTCRAASSTLPATHGSSPTTALSAGQWTFAPS
ncbi:helix-turn-helix domain-containing protein [Nocardia abscessus]|nr:helix-turn-helix domain-containing protein [Nocardia abscessus]